MSVRRIASRALRALLVLIAGFVVFDLLSAYAIARGASFYVALALGLVAFPAAPLVWHALGERKRRRKRAAMKVPPKTSTNGVERLLLRAGAVGALVIAALVGLTGGSWDAVRHHGLWFVPHAAPKLSIESPLVALVPARAEAFLWIRPTQAASDALTALGADAALLETVYALGAQDGSRTALDAALITRFPGDTLPRPAWLQALPLPAAPSLAVGPVATALGPSWRATRGWAGAIGSGPPRELIALAARVPADSLAVFVAKPTRARDADDIVSATAYATLTGPELGVAADIDLVSPETMTRFRGEVERALATARTLAFTTVACLEGHGATLDVDSGSTSVHLRASLSLDAMRACLPTR